MGGDGKPMGGLVNRIFPHLTPGRIVKGIYAPPAGKPAAGAAEPPPSPTSSGELSSAAGSRTDSSNSFAYRLQESDSASSLGSLADKVAEFVEPKRVREEIPHKATGACEPRARQAI